MSNKVDFGFKFDNFKLMQVFEFYFNPPLKEREKLERGAVFEIFSFEPKNIYEKRLGPLYILGHLENVFPKNLYFLEKLAFFIKENYYKKSLLKPERAFRQTLNEVNKFLQEMISKGDVSWLGNLNYAVLTLKDFKINFTKIGSIKIILLRGGKIIDLEKKLRLREIESFSLKVFENIVSGKLMEDDFLLIFTANLYDFFEKEKLIEEIAKLPSDFEEKIKKISQEKKEELKKICGALLGISLVKKKVSLETKIISSESKKEFSFWQVFKIHFRDLINGLKKLKQPTLNFVRKNILIFSFLFLIFAGWIITNIEGQLKAKFYSETINEIEKSLTQVENHLVDEKTSQILLKENFKKIFPVLKDISRLPKNFYKNVILLNERILNNLYTLNKIEKIEDPEIYAKIDPKKFVPQKFILQNDDLYLFSAYQKDILKIDKDKKEILLEIDRKFDLACPLDDLILFFTKPNQVTILKDGKFFTIFIPLPFSESNFSDIYCYQNNIYFLDKKSGQIIWYFLLKPGENYKIGEPTLLLEKAILANSISFDGDLWISEKDSILKYKKGELKEKIRPDIFPEVQNFSKIFTSPSLPYLFILEPEQKRILIFEKSGKIFKQFQSERFDNLLDFSISKDGKKIFLLNHQTVYQLNL
jgi:hypothetical protein